MGGKSPDLTSVKSFTYGHIYFHSLLEELSACSLAKSYPLSFCIDVLYKLSCLSNTDPSNLHRFSFTHHQCMNDIIHACL